MLRDQPPRDLLITAVFLVGLLAWSVPTRTAIAQSCRPPNSIAPDEALGLAVKLKTFVKDTFYQDGTGILIGDRGDTLLIATALHVVFDADQPGGVVRAYFYTDCRRPVVARICAVPDPKRDLDLAVLCVPAAAAPGARPPSFSRLGNVRRLGARTPVYPVGCPGGDCWGVGQPDKVLVAGGKQPRILFTTFFVAPGHSGGPLFNEWWEVVGMVTKHGTPLSEAVPIDSVLNAVCNPICRSGETLQSPFVPRGGYRFSLGFSALVSGANGEPNDRFPPQRLNLMYRLNPLLELHAGSMRLTPENLSVTAAMFGLGLNLPPKSRAWFNLFLEGGFGHVEGRFDAGGHYVDDNGTNVYVPLWRQVKDDGLGYGTGISLMALVVPRTIVEVTVGHWSFNRPPGAPAMPDVVWAAGLRFGI